MTITDVKETPAAFVWGKLKRAIPNFGVVSIRGDMDANARDVVDLDVQAVGYGAAIQIVGSAGAYPPCHAADAPPPTPSDRRHRVGNPWPPHMLSTIVDSQSLFSILLTILLDPTFGVYCILFYFYLFCVLLEHQT